MRETLPRPTRIAHPSFGRLGRSSILSISILGLTALAAPLAAQESAAQPGQPPPVGPLVDSLPDVVARVNGHAITKNQLLRQADSMRQQAVQVGATDPARNSSSWSSTR